MQHCSGTMHARFSFTSMSHVDSESLKITAVHERKRCLFIVILKTSMAAGETLTDDCLFV